MARATFRGIFFTRTSGHPLFTYLCLFGLCVRLLVSWKLSLPNVRFKFYVRRISPTSPQSLRCLANHFWSDEIGERCYDFKNIFSAKKFGQKIGQKIGVLWFETLLNSTQSAS
jgi:hypothetical protein